LNIHEKDMYRAILNRIISKLQSTHGEFYVTLKNEPIIGGSVPKIQAYRGKIRDNVQFGRFLVDKRQLGNGVLALQYLNRKTVPGLPKKKISKHLAQSIYNLSQGKRANTNYLSPEEEDLLNYLIDKSFIYHSFPKDEVLVPTGSKLKEELEVLIGEISVGNNSPKIKKRLAEIITFLYNNTSFPKSTLKKLSKYLV
jgi:hypothetical protein